MASGSERGLTKLWQRMRKKKEEQQSEGKNKSIKREDDARSGKGGGDVNSSVSERDGAVHTSACSAKSRESGRGMRAMHPTMYTWVCGWLCVNVEIENVRVPLRES